MPLTDDGRKVLRAMKKQYGTKKGEQVFYASINKGVAGSARWHKKREKAKGNKFTNALKG